MAMIGLGAIFAYVFAMPIAMGYLGYRRLEVNQGMAWALIAAAVLFVLQILLFGPLQIHQVIGTGSSRVVMIVIGAFGLIALLWRMFEKGEGEEPLAERVALLVALATYLLVLISIPSIIRFATDIS